VAVQSQSTSSQTPPVLAEPVKPESQRLLGQILVELGFITAEEIEEMLLESKKARQYLGAVLVHRGRITKEQLGKALAKQFNSKYIALSNIEIDQNLLKMLPEDFMRENYVLPVAMEGGKLIVAAVNPSNRHMCDEIIFMTGMRPQLLVTTSLEFSEAFTLFFPHNKGYRSLSDLPDRNELKENSQTKSTSSGSPTKKEIRDNHQVNSSDGSLLKMVNAMSVQGLETREDQIRQKQQAEMVDASNPLVKLVNSIIQEAIEKNASDIHVESREQGCVVRFRIDGILHRIIDIPVNMESSFMTRIKVMSRMDISEHRRPQDGRIGLHYKDTDYNLRVNTLPTSEGKEKIVIRILRPAKNITDFSDMGMSEEDTHKIETLYQSPYGIVLVCGPTGSGKTTTLYTILHKINQEMRNISTVEDPIELRIEGLNQSQINPKAEFTFALALRALLRQDPDVLMVGEIRDGETLESAIHASLTGHLVFSTLHSNTTAATVTRLLEMGANSNMICSALLGIIAQRLVRLLCSKCKAPYEASAAEKQQVFARNPQSSNQSLVLYRAAGCSACSNSGYSGRAGLFEIMMIDRNIKHMINNHGLDIEIEDAAISAGMKTLYMSAVELLLQGKTSYEELVRVLGPTLGRSV